MNALENLTVQPPRNRMEYGDIDIVQHDFARLVMVTNDCGGFIVATHYITTFSQAATAYTAQELDALCKKASAESGAS